MLRGSARLFWTVLISRQRTAIPASHLAVGGRILVDHEPRAAPKNGLDTIVHGWPGTAVDSRHAGYGSGVPYFVEPRRGDRGSRDIAGHRGDFLRAGECFRANTSGG